MNFEKKITFTHLLISVCAIVCTAHLFITIGYVGSTVYDQKIQTKVGPEVNVEVLDLVVDVKRVVRHEARIIMSVISVRSDGFAVNSCERDAEWKQVLIPKIKNEVNFPHSLDQLS